MQSLQYSALNSKTLYAGLKLSLVLLCLVSVLAVVLMANIFTLPYLLIVTVTGLGFMFLYLRRVGYWCMPFFLFQTITTFFFIGGFIVYQLRYYFYFPLTYNMGAPLKAFLVITFAANISYYFFDFLKRNLPRAPKPNVSKVGNFELRTTLLVAIAIILISYVSAYKLFGGFRSAPLFSADIDISRFALRGSRGYLWFGLFSAYHSVNLLFAVILNSRRDAIRDLILILMVLAAGFPLLLYGGRSLVVIPILIGTIFYANARQVKFRSIAAVGLILFVFIQLFGTYRSHNKQITFANYIHSVYTDTFSEVRTMAFVDENMEESDKKPEYLYSFIAAIFPRYFFSILGLNKEDYYLSLGRYVSSFDPQHSTRGQGYRVTLLGEVWLLHGHIGRVLWGVVLGFVFLLLDSICIRRIRGPNLYNYNTGYLIVLPMAAVPYGATFLSTIVWLLLQLLIINLVLRFKKTFTLSLRGAKRRSNLNKAHKLRHEIASLALAMTTF